MENTSSDSVAKLDDKQISTLLSFGLDKPEPEEAEKKPEGKKSRPTKTDDIQPTIQIFPKGLKNPSTPHE